jgi:hypothetical protein
MLKEVKMFTIVCDNCDKDVNYESEYSGWSEESYVEEIRQEAGWVKYDDEHYCPDCFEYDDEDELVIKNLK